MGKNVNPSPIMHKKKWNTLWDEKECEPVPNY